MKFTGPAWEVREKNIINAIIDYYGEKYFIGKSIVDIGCGHGAIGMALARLGADVLFSDVRIDHLDFIRRRGYKTYRGNIEAGWPFMTTFDIVLCIGILYHTNNPVFVLNEICKSSFHDLVIETEFCDSKDPSYMYCLVGKKERNYNHAISGMGCRPAYSLIQKIFVNNHWDFHKIDNDKYNSEYHVYNDPLKDTKQISNKNYRGIWFCRRMLPRD